MFRFFAACAVASDVAARKPMTLMVMLLALGTLVTGCAQPTAPMAKADPADASAPVPPVSYRPATASYRAIRSSVPAPWRQQNDTAAPPVKSDQ